MTATTNTPPGAPEQQKPETVDLTIDGIPVTVEKNTLVIRAAEQVGIQIPRFCDHPLLDPVGACRQCLVEVAMPDREGNLKPMPKPQASCTMTVAPGMEVKTQVSSPVADKAQRGVMELLLINNPLDCPVCDKGGECPLQNQAMTAGRAISRFEDSKRTYPKPINISSQVLLDRERCVLCARCTRFSDQVAGDPFIALVERGALQQVGIYEEQPFESYFSGNTVQICPVGALTGAAYRFRSRPFDLVSTPTTCEHCASGCAIRTDHRRGTVLRRMAWNDPAVNEEWNCDKGRWAFQYTMVGDRIEHPMVRDASGALVVVSWDEALEAAAAGLRAAGTTGVLTGGRLVVEDAAAYARFAREVLGTGSIDFRSRPHSAEEAAFLVEHVLGTSPETGGVTYADVEHAGSVLLVGVEPEEESPILFLRLRKAYRRNGTKVAAVAPLSTRGLRKVGGALIPSAPGTEVEVLEALRADAPAETGGEAYRAAHEALRAEGAIILVGERLATVPGALTAAAGLARTTGARLAWVPRRAGERGALEAGCLPTGSGLSADGMLDAARAGQLGALVVGGVELADLGRRRAAEDLAGTFVVSLEHRASDVTAVADVVLPVAPHAERSGTFLDWEGRRREVQAALETGALADHVVLDRLAGHLGEFLGTRSVQEANRALTEDAFDGTGVARGTVAAADVPQLGEGQFVLATWRQLLDGGRLQDGDPFLAGTAPAPRAWISPASAEDLGIVDGDQVTVTARTRDGGTVAVVAPVTVEEMVDRVVWLPTNQAGLDLRDVPAGSVVTLTRGGQA